MLKFSSMLKLLIIAIFFCLLQGCGVSNEAKSLAKEKVKEFVTQKDMGRSEFDNFEIESAAKIPIDSADKANGITDRCHIIVTYIKRLKEGERARATRLGHPSESSQWTKDSEDLWGVKRNGQWTIDLNEF